MDVRVIDHCQSVIARKRSGAGKIFREQGGRMERLKDAVCGRGGGNRKSLKGCSSPYVDQLLFFFLSSCHEGS